MEVQLHRLKQYELENPNELLEWQFRKIEEEILNPDEDTTSDEYFDFKLWFLGCPSRQESFANYVSRRLHKKGAKKVLEVGSGRTCRLSRMLEEKGFKMTCIDPKIDLQFVAEKNPGIILQKEVFDLSYGLSNFDYVIAEEPCDATEYIIQACIQQNKPFIMTLCGETHHVIGDKHVKNVYEWYDYLANISKDIRLRRVSLDPLATSRILLKD